MANRQVFPASLFPLRGDISAESGATTVIVQGLQGIPILAPPVEPAGLDTLFYDSYNNDWFYASPWDIPVGTPLVWEGYGYGSSGISWIAPDTLAFGNGTDGDVSGAAAMTALVLFGSQSYYGPYNDYDVDYGPSYDQFYTSIFSGATQNWNLILPPNPGTSGQVLTTNGTGVTYWSTVSGGGGSGTVTSFSSGNLSPLFTTSVTTSTTTPALSFALNTQNANLVFAGPISGGAATPTFRSLVAADLPSGTGTVTSIGLATGSGASDVLYTISGSPVTTSGILVETLNTQAKNTFLGGPISGANATPTFRVLNSADIPVPGSTSDILYNNGGVLGASLSTISAAGSISLPEGQVLQWEGGYGYYTNVALSILANDTLAVGDGTPGDVSGAAAMTALILVGQNQTYDHSYDYDQYYTTIYSGAIVDWVLTLPPNPGSVGQVLTTNGTGVTSWSAIPGGVSSITGDGVIISNSGSTGSVTLTLENAGQNDFLAGPSSGGTGAPTYRAIGTPDLPTSGTWAFAGTLSGNFLMTGDPQLNGVNNTFTLGLASYTAAISNSPTLVIAGSYESASAPTYAEDSWTIQLIEGSGLNGTSTLTFAQSGTSGQVAVAFPGFSVIENVSSITYLRGTIGNNTLEFQADVTTADVACVAIGNQNSLTASSGVQHFLEVTGNVNQTGLSGFNGILVDLDILGSGSGAQNLLQLRTTSTAGLFIVDTSGDVTAQGLGTFANLAMTGSPSTAIGELGYNASGAGNPTSGDGTNARIIPMNLYTGLGFGPTGNVTGFTTVLGSATVSQGSLTLVANQQIVGSCIHIHAIGTMDVATATQTISFEALLNGAAVTSQAVVSVVSASTYSWEYDAWIYCSATGAASTAAMYGTSQLKILTTAGDIYTIAPTLTHTTTTVATTSTQALDIRMKFGTSESSNTCSCFLATMDIA